MADSNSEGSRFAFNIPVRLYGPMIVKPGIPDYGNNRKGELGYYCQFFFPTDHPECKAFSEALRKVKAAKFGAEAKGVAMPFQMGDAFAEKWVKKHAKEIAEGKANPRDFAKGHVLVRASSKNYPPMLSYVANNGVVDIPDEARVASGGKFYSGVFAGVEVNLVAYEGNGSNIPDCVKAYISKVCSVGKGDRIGGGGSSAGTFAGLTRHLGQVSDENPTADLYDEIPF